MIINLKIIYIKIICIAITSIFNGCNNKEVVENQEVDNVVKPVKMVTLDISSKKDYQVIIAQGTQNLYNGHPTTVMLDDKKTIFCTWSKDHGGPSEFIAKSTDAGLTWDKLTTPEDWKTTSNCPSIYKLEDPKGKQRLMIFSGNPNMSQTYSEDMGQTWTSVKSLNFNCVMAFTSIIRLSNGDYMGAFHRQDGNVLSLWKSISKDGGLTWSTPTWIGGNDTSIAPAEPYLVRSPDGKTLVCVARENTHSSTSLMMFSYDEGRSWTSLRHTSWGLTGDRHIIKYLPDGRIIAVFRDKALQSSTHDSFVAWVGTYDDLINASPGQYRIKLLQSYAGFDCGYPGLEILPDGTVVATTYIKYEPGLDKQSIVSVRFNISETDRLFQNTQ